MIIVLLNYETFNCMFFIIVDACHVNVINNLFFVFLFFFFSNSLFSLFLYTGATVSGGAREANPPIRNLTVFIIHSMMSTNC